MPGSSNRGGSLPRRTLTADAAISRRRFARLAAASATILAAPRIAAAQAYPGRPVRAIVTFAPGGTVDVYARLACQHLSQKLGQQFVVENVSGATGNRGTAQAARAAADGYTLLFALSTHAVNASIFSNLPYDPVADFVPVNLSVSSTHVVSVPPSHVARNAREFVADLKAKPNQNYAHGGLGTQGHLLAERLKVTQNLDFVAVTFPGAGPAIQAVVANQIPSAWTTMASAGPMIAGGRLKALAVTGKARSPLLPEVPTMIEQGFPEIEGDTWVGIMAPAGTPDDVVATINREISQFLQEPAARRRLAEVGFDVVDKGPADFARILREEIVFWRKVVEETKVRIE
ncbi:Bug family tripartite tricarboxylate transporter substrate binding protein [Phreatobacter sp. AB_2022a]|uniref:Bug family tripartite tricarboxylate transporter substrate binding protein n=1 Tax=Phreatobacter sp. AB_2022a TaxID=3003134 RepID=UPI002286E1DD|nr:tripartite tricarboxylate transporter substrate-binding protein [Phreatobacter sp. AB_2022a]MCZ0736286.1 tripartite tricarboxylate transporter substrate-binding protein [Phreatobacter sp. AB_2022a]